MNGHVFSMDCSTFYNQVLAFINKLDLRYAHIVFCENQYW